MRYVVKFFKTVTGDNGYTAEVCQAVAEVEASSADRAELMGKHQFCEQGRLADWSLHADRCSVVEAEFPS
jgi:hypothetical protein